MAVPFPASRRRVAGSCREPICYIDHLITEGKGWIVPTTYQSGLGDPEPRGKSIQFGAMECLAAADAEVIDKTGLRFWRDPRDTCCRS